MSKVVIGPSSNAYPFPVGAPMVDVKRRWSEDWRYDPTIRAVRGLATVASDGVDEFEIETRYGRVKHEWESVISAKSPVDLLNWWVRVRLASDQGPVTVFIGQVDTESRGIAGTGTKRGAAQSVAERSGRQTWIAHGGLQILQRISVSDSYWLNPSPVAVEDEPLDDLLAIGWLPAINARDERGLVVGNRSATIAADGRGYVYGGTETWTHRQYLQYLLARFVQQFTATGQLDTESPAWYVAGQTDLLDGMSEIVDLGESTTAAEIVARLIPRRLGVDFRVVPVDAEPVGDRPAGFEIRVHALLPVDEDYGAAALPRNPNLVEIRAAESTDSISTRVVRDSRNRYNRVRILGRRIVVCCSVTFEAEPGIAVSLEKKWTPARETAYKAGTGVGGDDDELHDAAMRADKFRTVFQRFGVPTSWDFNGGDALPALEDTGATLFAPDEPADGQMQTRQTLDWTPLRDGIDYGTDPETDNNPAGTVTDFLPPVVYGYNVLSRQFEPVDRTGISVSASREDLGVQLSSSPNHRMGLNHGPFKGSVITYRKRSYDYTRVSATLAFRCDHRVAVVSAILTDGDVSPVDGYLDILMDDAELWILAPQTIVGLEVYDKPKDGERGGYRRSGKDRRYLRDDRARMAWVLAGAIARHMTDRARAEIAFKGAVPAAVLLGQILTVVEDVADATAINAPITACEWHFGGRAVTTVLRTGNAT